MNTLIYLWVEPTIWRHQRCNERLHFNVIIKGEHADKETDALDDLIEGKVMYDIWDFAEIEANWNFRCISAVLTVEKPSIAFADSPEVTKQKGKIAKIVSGEKQLTLTDKSVTANEDGTISVSVPALGVKDTIDFPKIWETIEKSFIDKIQPGDTVILTDDDGNKLFEVRGGSFLAVGLGDITIQTKDGAIKGGLYIREDGSVDIGDWERTVYVKIYTNSLLKASFKLKKSLTDIANLKLISQVPEAENEKK